MKIKYETPALVFMIFLFLILTYLIITASGQNDAGTNYTSQQIDNFVYGLPSMTSSVPDSSKAVRLMPDHIILFKSDTVKATDTIKFKNTFSKRYKFTLTVETATIYARLSGPGTDSVRIRPGEYISLDYLHPLYDSTLYIIDSSGTATWRLNAQGR